MRPGLRGYAMRGFAALGLLIVLQGLPGCRHGSDEGQVRQAIASAAKAARDNDADGVLAQVSDDFVGNEGDLDRHRLKQLLVLRALRHDSTGVLIGPVSVERQNLPRTGSGDERLIAKFTLTLVGGKSGSLLPDHADVFAMSTAWKREGGQWRCYSAT